MSCRAMGPLLLRSRLRGDGYDWVICVSRFDFQWFLLWMVSIIPFERRAEGVREEGVMAAHNVYHDPRIHLDTVPPLTLTVRFIR